MTKAEAYAAVEREISRTRAAVAADPRYERNVEGSWRRVFYDLFGYDGAELGELSEGVIWVRDPGGTFVRVYDPSRVAARLSELKAKARSKRNPTHRATPRTTRRTATPKRRADGTFAPKRRGR